MLRRKLWPHEREMFIQQAGGNDGGVCIYCKRVHTSNKELMKRLPHIFFSTWEIDHIIPLHHGGNNLNSNLHAVCQRCNQLKRDHTLSTFYTKLSHVKTSRR